MPCLDEHFARVSWHQWRCYQSSHTGNILYSIIDVPAVFFLKTFSGSVSRRNSQPSKCFFGKFYREAPTTCRETQHIFSGQKHREIKRVAKNLFVNSERRMRKRGLNGSWRKKHQQSTQSCVRTTTYLPPTTTTTSYDGSRHPAELKLNTWALHTHRTH